jgi:hypothetical protein
MEKSKRSTFENIQRYAGMPVDYFVLRTVAYAGEGKITSYSRLGYEHDKRNCAGSGAGSGGQHCCIEAMASQWRVRENFYLFQLVSVVIHLCRSPKSRIDKAEFTNEVKIEAFEFDNFEVRGRWIWLRRLRACEVKTTKSDMKLDKILKKIYLQLVQKKSTVSM